MVDGIKNSYPLFRYPFWWQGHSIGQQYLITSYLHLFDEAPEGASFDLTVIRMVSVGSLRLTVKAGGVVSSVTMIVPELNFPVV